MSPEDLARKCVHAINGGWEHVQLVIPGHVRGQRVGIDRGEDAPLRHLAQRFGGGL